MIEFFLFFFFFLHNVHDMILFLLTLTYLTFPSLIAVDNFQIFRKAEFDSES